MKKITLLFLWAILCLPILPAQTIDANFTPSFSAAGRGFRIVTQPDDKILLWGRFNLIDETPSDDFVRLLPDGSVDPSFQYDEQLADKPRYFALQSDGKIVIFGQFQNNNGDYLGAILRLLPNGTLDGTFQEVKDTIVNFYEPQILPNQKIFVAYSYCVDNQPVNCNAYGIRLYGKDGAIATHFPDIAFTPNHEGSSNSSVQDIGVQSNNALIVAGTELELDTLLQTVYRFDSTGQVDPSFNPEITSFSNFQIRNMDILPDGTMGFLGGGATSITILDSLGNLLVNKQVQNNSALLQATSNNSFLVVGNRVAHIFPDGQIFETVAQGPNNRISDMAAQTSGGVIITGSFDEVNGQFTPGIFRYKLPNPIVQFDDTFKAKLYTSGSVNSIVLQEDGKIVAGGNFDFVNGTRIHHLVRLNTDGSVDPTFNTTNTNVETTVNEIKSLRDGSLVVAGRYNANGIGARLNGLSLLDKDGYYLRPFPFPYKGSLTNAAYLEVDNKDRIYAGEGLAYAYGIGDEQESGQVLMQYEYKDPFSFCSTNYNEKYIDGLYRFIGLTAQSNNKLLIYGNRIMYDGSDTTCIIRATVTGERDPTFNPDLPSNLYANKVLVVDTNTIFISGSIINEDRDWLGTGLYQLQGADQQRIDFSSDFSRDGGENRFGFGHLGQLPNGWILVNGNFDTYQNFPIPSGKLMMEKNGEFIGEFLPDLDQINISDMAILDPSTLYIAGDFTPLEGGASLMRIKFPLVSTNEITIPQNELKITPNPVINDLLRFEIDPSLKDKSVQYSIVESGSGRLVQTGSLQEHLKQELILNNISAGHYFLQLQSNQVHLSASFIKIKD